MLPPNCFVIFGNQFGDELAFERDMHDKSICALPRGGRNSHDDVWHAK